MAASTSIPWRRNGPNSWNDLVQRVNQILENPPSGCDPIAPLPEVDECHKWRVQDITDMQDALKQACDTNEFTPVIAGDKWKKSIIDEIEAAIVTGFCDCGVCIPPCDNQGDSVETFITSNLVTECTENLGSFLCSEQTTNSRILFSDYLHFKGEYIIDFTLYCKLVKEVDDLQEELDDLNEELNILIDERDVACNINPIGAVCLTLTADVIAKEIEVDDKETELDDKTAERDAAFAVSNASKASMLATAAETVINAENAVVDGPPLIELVLTDPEPWTNWECDDPLKIPECAGLGPFAGLGPCEVKWKLQGRVFEKVGKSLHTCQSTGPEPGFPKDWITILSGEYTVEGTLLVFPFNSCRQQDVNACFSNDCSVVCAGCDTVVSFTVEFRQITNFPTERAPVECETGEPCTP